ncbi:MAG: hypothetical protein PHR92_16885 [Lachnospiraceae bacterium]|nr:hypothetical protein [Lachnospiraceae bacterium]
MKKIHSRFSVARGFLIFWTLFIGIGAVAGAACMLIKPDGSLMGMQGLLPYFQVLPLAEILYQDYLFPGIALLCVNGLPNLLAAALLLRQRKAGVALGGGLGITLMLWICIQFVIFPINFLDIAFFSFGILQAVTGYAAWVFCRQEQFTVSAADYPHIGTNPKRLVVYFSRMGYTKKLALEQAEKTGAEVYEIQTTERTAGTLGFWWCGRYGMHGWAMPIKPVTVELSCYEQVVICSPIWVFGLAGPVRSFCKEAKGKIKSADFILTHHTRMHYAGAAREMERLIGSSANRVISVSCPLGKQTGIAVF